MIEEESRLSPAELGRGAIPHGHLLALGGAIARANAMNLEPIITGEVPVRGVPLAVYAAQAMADAAAAFLTTTGELYTAAEKLIEEHGAEKIAAALGEEFRPEMAEAHERRLAERLTFAAYSTAQKARDLFLGLIARDISVLEPEPIISKLFSATENAAQKVLTITEEVWMEAAPEGAPAEKAARRIETEFGLELVHSHIEARLKQDLGRREREALVDLRKALRAFRNAVRWYATIHLTGELPGDVPAPIREKLLAGKGALADRAMRYLDFAARRLQSSAVDYFEVTTERATQRPEWIPLPENAGMLASVINRAGTKVAAQVEQLLREQIDHIIGSAPSTRAFTAIDTVWIPQDHPLANWERRLRLAMAVDSERTLRAIRTAADILAQQIELAYGTAMEEYPLETKHAYSLLTDLRRDADILLNVHKDAAGILVRYGVGTTRDQYLPLSPTQLVDAPIRSNLLARTFQAYRALAADPDALQFMERFIASARGAAGVDTAARNSVRVNAVLAAAGYLASVDPANFSALRSAFEYAFDTVDAAVFTSRGHVKRSIAEWLREILRMARKGEVAEPEKEGRKAAKEPRLPRTFNKEFVQAIVSAAEHIATEEDLPDETKRAIVRELRKLRQGPSSPLEWSLETASYAVGESDAAVEAVAARVAEEGSAMFASGMALRNIAPAAEGEAAKSQPVYLTEGYRMMARGLALGVQALDTSRTKSGEVMDDIDGIVARYFKKELRVGDDKIAEHAMRQYRYLAVDMAVEKAVRGAVPEGYAQMADSVLAALSRKGISVRGSTVDTIALSIAWSVASIVNKIDDPQLQEPEPPETKEPQKKEKKAKKKAEEQKTLKDPKDEAYRTVRLTLSSLKKRVSELEGLLEATEKPVTTGEEGEVVAYEEKAVRARTVAPFLRSILTSAKDLIDALEPAKSYDSMLAALQSLRVRSWTPGAHVPIAAFVDPHNAWVKIVDEFAQQFGSGVGMREAVEGAERVAAGMILEDAERVLQAVKADRSPQLRALADAIEKTKEIQNPVERLVEVATQVRTKLGGDGRAGIRLVLTPIGVLADSTQPEAIRALAARAADLGPRLYRLGLFLDLLTEAEFSPQKLRAEAYSSPARYTYMSFVARRLAAIRPPFGDPAALNIAEVVETAKGLTLRETSELSFATTPSDRQLYAAHVGAVAETMAIRNAPGFSPLDVTKLTESGFMYYAEPSSAFGRIYQKAYELAASRAIPPSIAEIIGHPPPPPVGPASALAAEVATVAAEKGPTAVDAIAALAAKTQEETEKQKEAERAEAVKTEAAAAAGPETQAKAQAATAAPVEERPSAPPAAEAAELQAEGQLPQQPKRIFRVSAWEKLPDIEELSEAPAQFTGRSPLAAKLPPYTEKQVKITRELMAEALAAEEPTTATADDFFARHKAIGGLHPAGERLVTQIFKGLGLPVPKGLGEKAAIYAVLTYGGSEVYPFSTHFLNRFADDIRQYRKDILRMAGELPEPQKMTMADAMRVAGAIRVALTKYSRSIAPEIATGGYTPRPKTYADLLYVSERPQKGEEPVFRVIEPKKRRRAAKAAQAAPPPEAQATPPGAPPQAAQAQAEAPPGAEAALPPTPPTAAPTPPGAPPSQPAVTSVVAGAPVPPPPDAVVAAQQEAARAQADAAKTEGQRQLEEMAAQAAAAQAAQAEVTPKAPPRHGRPQRERSISPEVLDLLRKLAAGAERTGLVVIHEPRVGWLERTKFLFAEELERAEELRQKAAQAYLREEDYINDSMRVAADLRKAMDEGNPELAAKAEEKLVEIGQKLRSRLSLGLSTVRKWRVPYEVASAVNEYLQHLVSRSGPILASGTWSELRERVNRVLSAFPEDMTLGGRIYLTASQIDTDIKLTGELLRRFEETFGTPLANYIEMARSLSGIRASGQMPDQDLVGLMSAARLWLEEHRKSRPPRRTGWAYQSTIDAAIAEFASAEGPPPQAEAMEPRPYGAEEMMGAGGRPAPGAPKVPTVPAGWGRRAGLWALGALAGVGAAYFLSQLLRPKPSEEAIRRLAPVGSAGESEVYPGGITVRRVGKAVEL